jgi:outer membrane protein insertion porin family/translocation and assembly module TamA
MRGARVAVIGLSLALVACISAGCREKGDILVSKLTFEGVKQVDKGALANALKTKQGSRFPWGKKRYFSRKDFEDDLKRIEAFYRDRGFPDAHVASVDVKPNAKQDAVAVSVRITEGEPITVAEIVYEGFDVLPRRPRNRLERELPLQKEQPLDRQLAAASRERAVNVFRDHGYPYAEVRLTNEPVEMRRERVVLHADPGMLAHFGDIQVNGEASVGDEVIRREMTFKPGDEYSRQKMTATQQKLYGMELFQFVNVESLEDKAEPATDVPIRVTVGESKHRKVNFGVGYGSEEKARARIRWDHVNFFGGARHLGLEGRWSSLDRGVKAEFREPFFFKPALSLNFEGQSWHASEPVFSQNTVGGRAIVRYQTNPRQYWSVSLINEYQKSTIQADALADPGIRDDFISLGLDPRSGETHGTVGALAFDFSRRTTNNLLDARRGYVLNGHIEEAGDWLWGTYNYLNVTLEGRYYRSVGGLFVIAQRVNLGALDPSDNLDANVPFHKRFFIGGANSNRGWGRFELSPLDAGFPVGGLTMFDASTEARFPIAGKIGGVLFLDYGNVWSQRWSFDMNDLHYAIGPGLRYQTPIGPARIDLGYQLNPVDSLLVNGEPQKRQWRLHFSIGQAF